MRLIDADELKNDLICFYPEGVPSELNSETMLKQILHDIDNAPTFDISETISKFRNTAYQNGLTTGLNKRPQGEDTKEKIIELFNKYNILLVHIDGQIVPVKNSSKQECYDLLYEIQELIEWRKLLFNKHMNEVYKNER